jgi:hypothetical protein
MSLFSFHRGILVIFIFQPGVSSWSMSNVDCVNECMDNGENANNWTS